MTKAEIYNLFKERAIQESDRIRYPLMVKDVSEIIGKKVYDIHLIRDREILFLFDDYAIARIEVNPEYDDYGYGSYVTSNFLKLKGDGLLSFYDAEKMGLLTKKNVEALKNHIKKAKQKRMKVSRARIEEQRYEELTRTFETEYKRLKKKFG